MPNVETLVPTFGTSIEWCGLPKSNMTLDDMVVMAHDLERAVTLDVRCSKGHHYRLQPVLVEVQAWPDGTAVPLMVAYGSERDFCNRCGRMTDGGGDPLGERMGRLLDGLDG